MLLNNTLNNIDKNDPNYYNKRLELNFDNKYKVFDTADYIVPPNEYNSIFIMTNFIETFQNKGLCPEVNIILNVFKCGYKK